MTTCIQFDRGTLRIDSSGSSPIPGARWDDRTSCWRAPAHQYRRVASELRGGVEEIDDRVGAKLAVHTDPWREPDLRTYQHDALDAWRAFGGKGVVVLPTGAGKTRLAIAALSRARTSALVLCPTRALLAQWRRELEQWYGGPVGIIGDGESSLERVTVMTFAGAYRRMDDLGDRFNVVVVDEVHHFSGAGAGEALEMCAAPYRMGLTATAPRPGSRGDQHLCAIVGPVVYELGVRDLAGSHLAPFHVPRICVRLEGDEADRYATLQRPFQMLQGAFRRAYPRADYAWILRAIARTPGGLQVVGDHHKAVDLATFPRAKRRMVASLIRRHRDDKTLVFTAFAEHAYTIAMDNLVPVITAEVNRAERDAILERFRDGRYRCLVSARVLNEGVDVPDANVAILVGGVLGTREFIQRVGRVLRPAPGKKALVYDLVTMDTDDDARSEARRRSLAA
jgi:superfamily II DNA or RNA helicase